MVTFLCSCQIIIILLKCSTKFTTTLPCIQTNASRHVTFHLAAPVWLFLLQHLEPNALFFLPSKIWENTTDISRNLENSQEKGWRVFIIGRLSKVDSLHSLIVVSWSCQCFSILGHEGLPGIKKIAKIIFNLKTHSSQDWTEVFNVWTHSDFDIYCEIKKCGDILNWFKEISQFNDFK